MHTVNFLARLVEHHQELVYAFIFICVIVEGEFILLCSGILIHLGALNVYLTLIIVSAGALCKTFGGYYIGSLIHDKWKNLKFFKHIERHVVNIMPHFERKPFWSIFISKFLMVNHIVILFSGYKKINFQKYLKAELCSTILWVPILLTLGYFFSLTALSISHEIWQFCLIVLLLIALFIFIDKVVSWLYQFFEEFYDNIP